MKSSISYIDLSTVEAEISITCIRSQHRVGLKNGLFVFRKKAKFCFHENCPHIYVFRETFPSLTAEKFNDDVPFHKNLCKFEVMRHFSQCPLKIFIWGQYLLYFFKQLRKVIIFLFSYIFVEIGTYKFAFQPYQWPLDSRKTSPVLVVLVVFVFPWGLGHPGVFLPGGLLTLGCFQVA